VTTTSASQWFLLGVSAATVSLLLHLTSWGPWPPSVSPAFYPAHISSTHLLWPASPQCHSQQHCWPQKAGYPLLLPGASSPAWPMSHMCLPEYTCQGFSCGTADAHVCFSEWFGQRTELYVSYMLSVWTSLSLVPCHWKLKVDSDTVCQPQCRPLNFQHVLILKTFNLGLWPEEAKTFLPWSLTTCRTLVQASNPCMCQESGLGTVGNQSLVMCPQQSPPYAFLPSSFCKKLRVFFVTLGEIWIRQLNYQ
jgi:hypothetical protein